MPSPAVIRYFISRLDAYGICVYEMYVCACVYVCMYIYVYNGLNLIYFYMLFDQSEYK